MAYSLEEEEKMLSMFESIAEQPIEQQRPYNEVRNPKPMMESACFEGTKVDFSSWTADSKKVGKAKTASNPDLSKGSKAAKGTTVATKGTKDQVTENDVVTVKKEDKQVTKLVTEDASHEAKGEPKAKSGSFDSAAKSAASAQRSKAESNKKFSEESKRQRKIDLFRDFVKSLGVDEKSKADAEKVLKKFDSISKYIGKPAMESAMLEGTSIKNADDYINAVCSSVERHVDLDPRQACGARGGRDNWLEYLGVDLKKWFADGVPVKRAANGIIHRMKIEHKEDLEDAFGGTQPMPTRNEMKPAKRSQSHFGEGWVDSDGATKYNKENVKSWAGPDGTAIPNKEYFNGLKPRHESSSTTRLGGRPVMESAMLEADDGGLDFDTAFNDAVHDEKEDLEAKKTAFFEKLYEKLYGGKVNQNGQQVPLKNAILKSSKVAVAKSDEKLQVQIRNAENPYSQHDESRIDFVSHGGPEVFISLRKRAKGSPSPSYGNESYTLKNCDDADVNQVILLAAKKFTSM